MKQLKVAMIAPAELPIPALRGGAIETLATAFLQQNEKAADFFVTVYQANTTPIPANEAAVFRYAKFVQLAPVCSMRYPVRVLFNHRQAHMLRRGLLVNEFLLHLCRRIKKEKPDVLLLEGCQTYAPYLKRKFPHIPLVLHVHTDILNRQAALHSEIVQSCNAILCVSGYIKAQVDAICPQAQNKTYVVCNGVDTAAFCKNTEQRKQKRAQLKYTDEDVVLVYSGRVCKEKGVDALAKAFAAIDNNHFKLLIIGAGWFSKTEITPFEQQLQQILRPCADRVLFTGYLPHAQLPQWLNSADIAVVPSVCNEAAGLVALEAAAVGLPVIATKQGGLPQYTGSNAVTVQADAQLAEHLQQAIRQLAGDAEQRTQFGINSLQFVQPFSQEAFYAAMRGKLNDFGGNS